jgi:hypothetical protein
MGKITDEKAAQIFEARKNGMTIAKITRRFGVSEWWCTKHLKGVKPDKNWLESRWRKTEREATEVLRKSGFSKIHDLNSISGATSHWDLCAEREGKSWLIDVTVNGGKSPGDKGLHVRDGYTHAILLKDAEGKWKLQELPPAVELLQ